MDEKSEEFRFRGVFCKELVACIDDYIALAPAYGVMLNQRGQSRLQAKKKLPPATTEDTVRLLTELKTALSGHESISVSELVAVCDPIAISIGKDFSNRLALLWEDIEMLQACQEGRADKVKSWAARGNERFKVSNLPMEERGQILVFNTHMLALREARNAQHSSLFYRHTLNGVATLGQRDIVEEAYRRSSHSARHADGISRSYDDFLAQCAQSLGLERIKTRSSERG